MVVFALKLLTTLVHVLVLTVTQVSTVICHQQVLQQQLPQPLPPLQPQQPLLPLQLQPQLQPQLLWHHRLVQLHWPTSVRIKEPVYSIQQVIQSHADACRSIVDQLVLPRCHSAVFLVSARMVEHVSQQTAQQLVMELVHASQVFSAHTVM